MDIFSVAEFLLDFKSGNFNLASGLGLRFRVDKILEYLAYSSSTFLIACCLKRLK